jgi:peptidoglycan hydrolase-like protein with peptidoglycan-binding domain
MISNRANANFFTLGFLTIATAASMILGIGSQSATAKPGSMMPSVSPTMSATSSQTSSTKNQILRIGSRGTSVNKLQTSLKKAGFYQGVIDGIFGRQTQASVIKFQQSKKLSADGVVGAKTWSALSV